MSSDADSASEGAVEVQRDEDWEEWDGSDAEEDATRSLFGDVVLPSPEAAFAHDAATHGFDLRQFRALHHLDDYDTIRVVNFIRREVAAGRDPLPVLAGQHTTPPWAGDEFLAPVLLDDPLITYDYEQEGDSAPSGSQAPQPGADTAAAGSSGRDSSLAALQAENDALREALAALMLDSLPEELRSEVPGMDAAGASTSTAAAATAGPSTSTQQPGAAAAPAAAAAAAGPSTSSQQSAAVPSTSAAVPSASGLIGPARPHASSVDAAYFDSYSTFHIHREMLGDKARTDAYRTALERNPKLLSGAHVLDVGCGTGILSLFAARGGAAQVVGVDGSERIATLAQQVADLNGLSASAGGPVRIISGRVEHVEDIGMQQVDVIVSEWMGYALLFESMLDSVLHARDKWLRPGGAVLPDIATIHIAGVSDAALGLDFWNDVYGFNMSPLRAEETSSISGRPLVREVSGRHLVTQSVELVSLDLTTMARQQQDFSADFTLEPLAASSSSTSTTTTTTTTNDSSSNEGTGGGHGSSPSTDGAAAATPSAACSSDGDTAAAAAAVASTNVAAIALWFDTTFSERFCTEQPVVLSTAPTATTTHWVQTLLPFKGPITFTAPGSSSGGSTRGTGGAVKIAGRISMARSSHKHRHLDISLEYRALDGAGAVVQSEVVLFPMGVTDPAE